MVELIRRNRKRFAGFLIPAIIFALLPLWMRDPYHLHLTIVMGTYIMATLGVRLILNCGQWNFGQAGFMAIGAYAAAILATNTDLTPFWATAPIAGLITALVALIIGFPALRAKGLYFAILTLAFSMAVRQAVIAFSGVTGGHFGIHDIPPPASIQFAGLLLDFGTSKIAQYYLMCSLVAITILVMYRLDNSRFGMVLRSIAGNDTLVESVGVPALRYKLIAFVISSFFAGLAGAYSAHYTWMAHPDFFTVWESLYIIVYVVFGGASTIPGVILGTSVLIGMMEALKLLAGYREIIYAAILILVILFLPKGLISISSVISKRIEKLRSRRRLKSSFD